jgi:formiminotetrahydrofolate cyclodeaminase
MYGQQLKNYIDDLAAKLPAPGGGSAAALTACLGASLVSMVINFTLGKPKYSGFEEKNRRWLEISEKLRGEFLNLVDLDVEAYRSKDMRKALDVPLMVSRLCAEASELCPSLIATSNSNLVSDLSAAAILLESAFASAKVNVEINLRALDDAKLSKQLRRELDANYKKVKKLRSRTEARVGKIIRG